MHVHERIDPCAIIEAVCKRKGSEPLFSLFNTPGENPPIRQAIEFYKHRHNWTNRLIVGDSLLVMNSLLEKEGLSGQVQTIYIDPPYGICYSSNFQPFVNCREVIDGKDEDLNGEPEQIRAFRDTWELGIHSYLTYLRNRLLLASELLHENGSCFVQIGDENVHHVRELMDEVFGERNFVTQIYFSTTGGFASSTLSRVGDYLVWYARDRSRIKYHRLFQDKPGLETGDDAYRHVELAGGSRRPISKGETQRSRAAARGRANLKIWRSAKLGVGERRHTLLHPLCDRQPSQSDHKFLDGYLFFAGFTTDKKYVVETNPKVVQRCILMTSDPGDLVFDPTCGSGTTAYVAPRGRRARQTTGDDWDFDYHELARPDEGLGSGFDYETAPHVTLKSIANNPDIKEGMTPGRDRRRRRPARVAGNPLRPTKDRPRKSACHRPVHGGGRAGARREAHR